MANGQISLLDLFGQVSKTMQKNQKKLNEADSYNHDHGDHMVEIFDVISQAMKEKKNADPADQLEYAAKLLRNQAGSGSGKLYAEGLKKAAKTVTGKELNAGTILSVLQTIMGAGGTSAGASDGGGLLGSLMGQAAGGASSGSDLLGSLLGQSSGSSSGGGDLLGSLLGGLGGTGDSSQEGLDLGDLLGAGMDYMSSKQSGKSDMEALTGALLKGATMTQSPHRAQSSELVTSTLLKALSTIMNTK
jgi:hypothetical protein